MRLRAAAALVAVALVAVLAALGLTRGLERSSYDARLQLRGAHPTDELAVIAIDDATFGELRQQWPLRRSLHARVVDRLREAGVKRIVYDVQFTEPSARLADDRALLRSITRARGTVLATGESDGRGHTHIIGGDDARAGAANLPSDAGGVIRRYEPAVAGLPTIAARVAPDAKGGLIDYRGPPGTIPAHSFVDVLRGRVPASELRGRTVVVGATAATLQDVHPTAAGDGLMAGPEIQANAIWTALHGDPLREVPGAVAFVLLVLFALAGVRRGRWAALAGGAYVLVAYAALTRGLVLPVAVPVLGAISVTVAVSLVRFATETRARRAVTRDLAQTQLEAVDRLARASELRDDDTGEHIDRMSRLCELVALELGWPAIEASRLRRAATLHDVGKIGLPDAILRKPGRLTPEEIEVMRRHTTEGARLLDGSRSELLTLAEVIARTHHERWDGSGYPAGLAREQIPLVGRIAAVCDVYDALVSARPYKRAWTIGEALAEIADQRGRHFDPLAADALLAVIARDQPEDPGWRLQTTEAVSASGVPSTAASARSTEVATQVKVGVSRLV